MNVEDERPLGHLPSARRTRAARAWRLESTAGYPKLASAYGALTARGV
jgi:hypothetical protein